MNFKEELKNKARLVEAMLESMLPSPDSYPPSIHQAMRYSVMGGGKRLRPALVIAGAETVGGKVAEVLPAACAVELVHVYSLIHDDLPAMDDDDYRRGKLTNHKVYGEALAILAGDALLTLAFKLLTEMESFRPEKVLKVINELAAGAGTFGLVGGQVVDTCFTGESCGEEVLEYIHRHKTGALYRVSVRIGAILAGASEKQLDCLTAYAENLGLAFQIKDDILDIEGDEKKLGKPVGSDTKNEKLTYPTFYGLENSRQKAFQAAEKAQEALRCFDRKADFLRALVDFVIHRDH